MKWNYIKNILTASVLIITVEVLRYYTGLPFTIIDIIIFPFSIILLLFGVKTLLSPAQQNPESKAVKLTAIKLFGVFIVAILFFLLGAWAIYEGGHNPLTLYSGVKGAAHGYTLLSLGLLISAFSGYYIYLLAIKAIKPS